MKNAKEQTALHIALVAGQLTVAERLVGYGADVNCADKDGDTPLHYSFVLPKTTGLPKNTPQLLTVLIFKSFVLLQTCLFSFFPLRFKTKFNPRFQMIMR